MACELIVVSIDLDVEKVERELEAAAAESEEAAKMAAGEADGEEMACPKSLEGATDPATVPAAGQDAKSTERTTSDSRKPSLNMILDHLSISVSQFL